MQIIIILINFNKRMYLIQNNTYLYNMQIKWYGTGTNSLILKSMIIRITKK